MICPHETPGGPQRCPLCRRDVEQLHDPHGLHDTDPDWKAAQRAAERAAVPMPDHVRKVWDELRQGRRPAPPRQDELL